MSIMNDGLVSVIVPIFNQEKYLDRCIESIVKQEYENVEIILIDDGSTDSSKEIIKKWEQTDERIYSFRKMNGGLSDARNYGLRKANGRYVLFVDADDWIETDMISIMSAAMERENADMVICGYYKNYPDGREIPDAVNQRECVLLDTETMLRRLLKDDCITFHAWRRLYKRELIGQDIFPKGHNYEDAYAVPLMSMVCSRAVYLSKALYHYWQNPEGISSSFTFANKMDYLSSFEHTFQLIEGTYPRLKKEIALSREKHAMVAWDNYLVVDLLDDSQERAILDSIISMLDRIPAKYLPVRFDIVNCLVRMKLPKFVGRVVYRKIVMGRL